jgi:DnaJ family protein C protein 2
LCSQNFKERLAAEAEARRKKEEAEAEERAKQDVIKKEREKQKKLMKKERTTLRGVCKTNNYFVSTDMERVYAMEEVERLCESMEYLE